MTIFVNFWFPPPPPRPLTPALTSVANSHPGVSLIMQINSQGKVRGQSHKSVRYYEKETPGTRQHSIVCPVSDWLTTLFAFFLLTRDWDYLEFVLQSHIIDHLLTFHNVLDWWWLPLTHLLPLRLSIHQSQCSLNDANLLTYSSSNYNPCLTNKLKYNSIVLSLSIESGKRRKGDALVEITLKWWCWKLSRIGCETIK